MSINTVPTVFARLHSDNCIYDAHIIFSQDGFWMLTASLSQILARKNVMDFPDGKGGRLACDKFYDDWFLYAAPSEGDHVYSLLKLREQEHDAECGDAADGDTPGVTISFISFSCEVLLECLAQPTDENRLKLDAEIDRVVSRRGERHHKDLKRYFAKPQSEGAYIVADRYAEYIACFAEDRFLDVPERYVEISRSGYTRLRRFVESVNQAAGYVVCDHKRIHFQNPEELTEHERSVILATHTGNTSCYSFAAEVEYHARFLTPLAKIKIPLLKKSAYESAVRADMTIGDAERRGSAPFYREGSVIVRRQYRLHKTSEGGKTNDGCMC